MDELQLATNQYFQMMNANIVAYDSSLSKSLTTREHDIEMIKHINNWKAHLLNIINDKLCDSIQRQVAEINLNHINSWLRVLTDKVA